MAVKKVEIIKELGWLFNVIEKEEHADIIRLYWESGRGSGKNILFITLISYLAANKNKKINVACYRKQRKDLKQLWNEFEEWTLYPWDVRYKLEEASLNGNRVSFNSLYTSSGQPQNDLGKSMPKGADIMFVWTDETTQITAKDISKIKQAYSRHAKKMVMAMTWNPWSPYNHIVAKMASYMPYPGVEYMKQHHYQDIRVEEEDYLQTGEINIIVSYFIRTSAYINPFASKAHYAELEDIARYDEDEGNTILWAKPGVVDGAVYKDIDSTIKTKAELAEQGIQFKNIIAGIDFGTTDATTVSLVGISSDRGYRSNGIHIIDEYYHQNEKGGIKKDINDYCIEVIDYLKEMYNKYHVGLCEIPILRCYVDYARQTSKEIAFVDMLRQRALEMGITHIIFEKATKEPIRDRITLTKYLIATGRFTIDKDTAKNHIREFTNINYDTSKTTPDGFHPRSDGEDHAINAFEYALSAESDNLHSFVGINS